MAVLRISGPGTLELAAAIFGVADLAAATVAAMVICAAWARRLQTGEGEHIDVAMADVVASCPEYDSMAVEGDNIRV